MRTEQGTETSVLGKFGSVLDFFGSVLGKICPGLVSIHLLVGAIPILVELIDDKCGVTVHPEAFNTELDSYTDTMKCRLIFSGIVACSEV